MSDLVKKIKKEDHLIENMKDVVARGINFATQK